VRPGRLVETLAAWLLGVLWLLPLAYAVWTAFHPREYSARFVPTAPLTLMTRRRSRAISSTRWCW